MYRYKSFVLCLSILLAACSAPSTKVGLPEMDKTEPAVIYLYRPLSLANSMVMPGVMLNGSPVGKIPNGDFMRIPVALHRQVLTLDLQQKYLGDKLLSIQVQSQHQYFVRVSSSVTFQMNKPYLRYFNLQQVDEKTALEEMGSMLKDAAVKAQPVEISADQETLEAERLDDAQFSIDKSRNPFAK